jgi:N-acetyl-beta-hexosaminidase
LAGAFVRRVFKNLDTMGKKLIGWKDINSLGGFPASR